MNKIRQFVNKIFRRSIKKCIALFVMFACILSSSQVMLSQSLGGIIAKLSEGGLVVSADAADTGNLENTYVLNVATGINPGTRVLYFTVKYKDVNNQSLTHYVLLSDDELQKMYSGVANLSAEYGVSADNRETIEQRINKVKNITGYAVPNYTGAPSSNESGIGENVTPLSSMGNDSFIIKTETAIKTVEEINFFVNTGSKDEKSKIDKNKNEWTCNDMRLYKADKIYGLDMYGYYSNKYFLRFDGTEIAAMKSDDGKKNYSWSADKLIRVKKEKAEGVELVTGQKTPYSGANPKEVFFELGIEDQAYAGIESMVTSQAKGEKTISKMGVAESLILTVEYMDIYDDMRRVEMPYITSSAAWASSFTDVTNAQVIGLAQQGESLGFVATLPDFASLTAYQFDYASEKINELGLDLSTSAAKDARLKKQQDMKDDMSIAYFAAYDTATNAPEAKVVDGSLVCTASGSPQMYYASENETLLLGGKITHNFKEFREGTSLEPKDYANTYLVSIKTDDTKASATTSSISMRINYTDTSGNETETKTYSLKDLASTYYGYWQNTKGDIAYLASVSQGAELNVLLTLNDVETFENVTFFTDGYALDDWQASEFKISKVNKLSKRKAEWKTITVDNSSVDRRFFREVGSDPLVNCGTKVYVKGDGTGTELSLVSKSVTEAEDENWLDKRFSMTFDEANKNLGFTKARNAYTVNVKVGNEKNLSMSSDDCGSKNLFYFQLVFKGGRSGYVLANQQITSDGFRSGVIESFTIYANQNYGELVSINIIPDDLSSNSTIFDKLKVDSVTVTKESTGGLSRQWSVNNVGWIMVDYRDDGESSRKTGRPARTEAEVARNFAVTSKTFVMNLLFALTTSINLDDVNVDYDQGDTINEDNKVLDKFGNVKGVKFPQFIGTMMADILYYNGAGESKKLTVDVVKEMYKYAYLQPKYDSKNAQAIINGQDASALSDPSFMFRPNHTNRFIIPIDDISRIEKISFYATSNGTTTWFVNNVSVSLIDSDGTIGINDNDEYERSAKSRIVATSLVNDKPYDLFCTKDLRQELDIRFNPNEIKIEKIDDDAWSAAITREPTTTNDILNVYIYTNKIEQDAGDFNIRSYVKFTDAEKQKNQTSSGNMLRMAGIEEGEYVFYAMGLSAKNLATLDALGVHMNAKKTLTNYAKFAIIQRVRSGVMIQNYRIDFPSHISDLDLLRAPNTEASTSASSETQAVTIKLGKEMEKNSLVKMNKDLAVAISYTTTLDAKETAYVSPYKYVTDEQYFTLMAGDTVTLNFKQPYLKAITGIKLVTTGGIKVPVESAYVATYIANDSTDGANKATGWYSFLGPYVVTSTSDIIAPASSGLDIKGALTSVDIKLVGGKSPEEVANTALTQRLDETPLKVTIGYVDNENVFVEAKFDDIRKHKQATKTKAVAELKDGETVDEALLPDEILASVMLNNVKEISWVRVEPYDDVAENIVSVYIKKVELTHNTPVGAKSTANDIIGRNIITEGQTPVFQTSFAKGGISLEGTSFNFAGSKEVAFQTSNQNIALSVMGGKPLTFTPTLSGGLKSEVTVECKKKINEADFVEYNEQLKVNNGVFTFDTPVNTSKSTEEYILKVYPKEKPDTVIHITLSVPSPNEDIKITLKGSYVDRATKEKVEFETSENGSVEMNVLVGEKVDFSHIMTNSNDGYILSCSKGTPGDSNNLLSDIEKKFTFSAPKDLVSDKAVYKARLTSKANPNTYAELVINVFAS